MYLFYTHAQVSSHFVGRGGGCYEIRGVDEPWPFAHVTSPWTIFIMNVLYGAYPQCPRVDFPYVTMVEDLPNTTPAPSL